MLPKIPDAQVFLVDFLKHGPKTSSAVLAVGAVKGFSQSTLRRAKEALGISMKSKTVRKYLDEWHWQLPDEKGESPPLGHYGDFESYICGNAERIDKDAAVPDYLARMERERLEGLPTTGRRTSLPNTAKDY